MCGIFGWIPSASVSGRDMRRIAEGRMDALRHRGPDDAGFMAFPRRAGRGEPSDLPWTEKDPCADGPHELLLGQTRLSILDLSPAGHQPMRSDDGRYTLVYNGEIYNYWELGEELSRNGVVFRSRSDTEVLLQALIAWGEGALARLTGMFAFALHDAVERMLFCARDFFGIKPFYWHRGRSGLCFASEIPALLGFPGVPRRVNANAAYQYLCYGQYDVGGATMLEGVNALPPAHCMRVALDAPEKAEPVCYWRPSTEEASPLGFDEAAERLRSLFLDSVRLHLRSDVPLGVALSGGIDSSAVACAVRRLEPDADLHAFSFIAAGSAVSEEKWAGIAAESTRARRHTVVVQPGELRDDLDALLMAQGEPFGSTSIYAQYRVFKLAKDCGIKVTLDGQGADELLAGYHRFTGTRTASLLGAGDLIGAWRFLAGSRRWPGRSAGYLLKQVAREYVPSWLTPLALRCVGRSAAPDWLDTTALRDAGVRLVREDPRRALYPSRHKLRQILATQLTWNGLPQLLRHGDRCAMAHSIESRVPFLTRELAEFCLSLPEEYLVDMRGRSKSVFREAMRGIVPDAILDRRDKIGFATPEREWLGSLTGWIESTLADAGGGVPYLKMDAARREWGAIRSGGKAFDWRVWRWLCYARWARLFGVG